MQFRIISMAVVVVLAAWAGFARAQEQAPDPQQARSPQEILADLNSIQREIGEARVSPQELMDPAKRQEAAPKMIPPLKRLVGLMTELEKVEPRAKPSVMPMRYQNLAMLAWLGDAESRAALDQAAKGQDQDAAAAAQASLLMIRFWEGGKDEAGQLKVLDELKTLAQANSQSASVALVAMTAIQQAATSRKVRESAEDIVLDDIKDPNLRGMQEHLRSQRKMREQEGKPIVLEGQTIEGEKFSTADWKGKVILVDFWATWCGPCIAELPHVKKVYQQYHDKGLEMVGISCDQSADALKNFLAKDKEMTWPQLFDPNAPRGWHPLATQYGVQGIPTMFLIDRKGILRSVTAREDMDTLIPELLAEQAE